MNIGRSDFETTKNAELREKWVSEDFLFKDESYRIIGACFEVYKEKGNGFLEPVYQECLGIEFQDLTIPCIEQARLKLAYKGRDLKATGFKLGLLVNFGHHPQIEYERFINERQ